MTAAVIQAPDVRATRPPIRSPLTLRELLTPVFFHRRLVVFAFATVVTLLERSDAGLHFREDLRSVRSTSAQDELHVGREVGLHARAFADLPALAGRVRSRSIRPRSRAGSAARAARRRRSRRRS